MGCLLDRILQRIRLQAVLIDGAGARRGRVPAARFLRPPALAVLLACAFEILDDLLELLRKLSVVLIGNGMECHLAALSSSVELGWRLEWNLLLIRVVGIVQNGVRLHRRPAWLCHRL